MKPKRSAAQEARAMFNSLMQRGGAAVKTAVSSLPKINVQKQIAPVVRRVAQTPIPYAKVAVQGMNPGLSAVSSLANRLPVPRITPMDFRPSNVRTPIVGGIRQSAIAQQAQSQKLRSQALAIQKRNPGTTIGQWSYKNLPTPDRAVMQRYQQSIADRAVNLAANVGGGRNTAADLAKASAKRFASKGPMKMMRDALRQTMENRGGIVDVLKRFEIGEGYLPNGQADIGMVDDAYRYFKMIYGANKKPPREFPKIIDALKYAVRSANAYNRVGALKIDDAGVGLGLGLAKRGDQLPIRPNNRVGMLDLAFNRTRNVIAKQGAAGQELAKGLLESRDVAERTAGDWVRRLPTARKLSKKEFANFADAAEGNARPINEKVARAVAEWGQVREEVFGQAQGAGLDIGRIENYFPHRYDPQLFSDRNKFNQAINHLVESGQARTPEEAAQLMRHTQDVMRNRRFGNLESERLVNLPFYERTPEALMGYLEGSANRIAQVQRFGKNDERAMEQIAQIAREGGDAQTARELFDTAIGAKRYGEASQKVSKAIRGYNTLTKLGLGAVTNVGQSVNTATVTGVGRTLMGMIKAPTPKARDFALKAGVTLDGVIQDLREGSGFSGKVLGKLTAPGFGTVERFNRTTAAWAGKGYAEALAKSAAKGNKRAMEGLRKVGLDPDEVVRQGGALTEDQQITAARRIVERTQFKVDPQDLPGWSTSPWGKVVTQFKTFSYNQTAFMKREIFDEAKKGNFLPLIRFAALAIPVGGTIKETRNFLTARESDKDPMLRYSRYFQQAGGFGLAGDVFNSFFPMNEKSLPPERQASMVAGTMLGPTFGTAVDALSAGYQAKRGSFAPAGRFALRNVPIAGPALQNTLIPYQGQQETGKLVAERTVDELQQLSPEEANQRAMQIKQENPALFRLMKQEVRAQQAGLSDEERKLGRLGVVDNARAKEIAEEMRKLSLEEQNAYAMRLRQGGILTDDVLAQLKAMKQRGEL